MEKEQIYTEESLITKQFYLVYHALLTNKNESEFILALNNITCKHSISLFTDIKNIKALIFNLAEEKLFFSYKMCLLTYVKSDLFNKICYFMKDNHDNENSSELIVMNMKRLKQHIMFINAFNTFPQKLKEFDDGRIDESGTATKDAWYEETKIEMYNRLQQLVAYFGLNIYKIFEIKKKSNDKVMELSYKKTCNYYNKIINKIKKGIKKYIQLCEVYLEVEKTYVTSMITSDPSLDLDEFDLVIEQEITEQENDTDKYSDSDSGKLIEELQLI